MKIYHKELWAAIQRYVSAREADSWKSGGDPDAIPEIEKELTESTDQLDKLIKRGRI